MGKIGTDRKALVLLLTITLFWGFSFIPTSILINSNATSEMLLVIRFGTGAIALFIFAFKQIMKININDIKIGIIAGLAVFFAMYLQNLSLSFTSVSKTAFIAGTAILIVPFLAYFINKKEITSIHVKGISIAFIGLCLLSLNPNDLTAINFGDLLSLLSTIGFALQIVILEKNPKTNAICVSFVQVVIVALGGLILCIINQADFSTVMVASNIPIILYLGVICTGFCYAIQAWVTKHISSIIVTVVLSSQAVIAMIFDIIIFDEAITTKFLIGASLLIFANLYLTLKKPKPKKIEATTSVI